MRRGIASAFLIALAAATLLAPAGAFGQEPSEGATRKVVNKVIPQYPELARHLQLRGAVKVELLVAPSGSIKSTKVIGGNPVLVTAAVDAVRKWKYAPAPADSTELVELRFSPQ